MLSNLVLSITSVVLIFVSLKYGNKKVHYRLAAFCTAPLIWGVGACLLGLIKAIPTLTIVWKISLLGPIFAPPLFYQFIVSFTNVKRSFPLIALYTYAMLFYIFGILITKTLQGIFIYGSIYYMRPIDARWNIFIVGWVISIFFMLYELYIQSNRSKGEIRKQIQYFLFWSIVGFTGAILNALPFFGFSPFPISNVLVAIYFFMTTYTILRYQFFDISVVIKKTLIYSVLISVLSIIYFVLVYLIEKAFSVAMGYQSAILTVLAIVVLAIIFTPLKNRIQHAIDKYFFKGSIGEIEQEKHLLEDEIGRSERLKTISSLAAGMAHEIKNPLTSIKTFVEYVDKKYSDPEFKEKFKSIVPKEIDKIASIINQLLDYSKVDRISLRKVDIHKLLGYVTDLHSNEFIIKNIEAKISYEATNPIIKCDENKIKQAFINLILNSIEAMKKGGELSIHTKDIDNDIEIIIKDTGYGIAKDKLNKIFDPFFTTKEAGTGLGLFIVHQIVHNNNGKIGIESTEGRGTTIRVRFPRVI